MRQKWNLSGRENHCSVFATRRSQEKVHTIQRGGIISDQNELDDGKATP